MAAATLGCCLAVALSVAVLLFLPVVPPSSHAPPSDFLEDVRWEPPQPAGPGGTASGTRAATTASTTPTTNRSAQSHRDDELWRKYSGTRWHIYRLPAEEGARCLDGSPAAFYVRMQPPSQPRGWLIFFEGGGWCHHEGPCGNRRPGGKLSGLGTSKEMAATASLPQLGGILNRQSSPFKDYNMVFWKYCDASSYLSQASDPVRIGGHPFTFRGRRILEVGVEHLKGVFRIHEAPDVVVAGHSAGGMGVMLNLRFWRDALPATVPLYGIMDGGFFLDVQSYEEGREESRRYAAGLRYWNATPALDPKCASHHAPQDALWKCLLPHHFWPYLPPEVPLFVSQSKYDIHALKVFVGAKKGKYNASEDFRRISHIGRCFEDVLHKMQPSGLWLPACSQAFAKHAMMMDGSFCFSYKIDGLTLCDAIGRWHRSCGRLPVRLEDRCVHPCEGGKDGACKQLSFTG